uniref:Uncharacterized protein n=1 Tax=Anopheles maculatus TaxID=74869 RepID=A0A182S7T4_9DIPT
NTTIASNGSSTTLATTRRSVFPTSGDLPTKLSESFSVYDYGNDYDDTVPNPSRHTAAANGDTNEGDRILVLPLDEHDGYLRPEQTHYEPLVRQPTISTGQIYRDYWTQDGTKIRTYTDYLTERNLRPLYHNPTQDNNRYAPGHDKQLLLDDYSDKFVGLLLNGDKRDAIASDDDNGPTVSLRIYKKPRMISSDRKHKDTRHETEQRSIRDDATTKLKNKRPINNRLKTPTKKPSAISLVPFVLLTSVDRPDNWVMYHSKPSKQRKPPVTVPLLKSDAFSLSEFPKPIAEQD